MHLQSQILYNFWSYDDASKKKILRENNVAFTFTRFIDEVLEDGRIKQKLKKQHCQKTINATSQGKKAKEASSLLDRLTRKTCSRIRYGA